jgi:hypothetical protein
MAWMPRISSAASWCGSGPCAPITASLDRIAPVIKTVSASHSGEPVRWSKRHGRNLASVESKPYQPSPIFLASTFGMAGADG